MHIHLTIHYHRLKVRTDHFLSATCVPAPLTTTSLFLHPLLLMEFQEAFININFLPTCGCFRCSLGSFGQQRIFRSERKTLNLRGKTVKLRYLIIDQKSQQLSIFPNKNISSACFLSQNDKLPTKNKQPLEKCALCTQQCDYHLFYVILTALPHPLIGHFLTHFHVLPITFLCKLRPSYSRPSLRRSAM